MRPLNKDKATILPSAARVPSSVHVIFEAKKRAEEQYRQLYTTVWADEFKKHIEQSLRPFIEQQKAIEKQWHQMIKPSKILQQYFSEIAKNNKQLLNESFYKAIKEQVSFHNSWKKFFEQNANELKHIISNSIKLNLHTESLFIKSDISEILKSSLLNNFQKQSFNNFFESYAKLNNSFKSWDNIINLPTFVLPESRRENWFTSLSLSYLRRKDLDLDNKDAEFFEAECQVVRCEVSGLSEDFPDIAKMIVGAKQALISNTIEATRHVLVSLREAFTHLLHRLAPDELVLQWVLQQQNPEDYLHEKRPTRKTRLLYICKEVSHGPLIKFFEKDIAATLELVDIFQDVHESESSLTPSQLKCIIAKTESAILFVMKVSREKF